MTDLALRAKIVPLGYENKSTDCANEKTRGDRSRDR
jgi:hypothetical protein